jgi:predicted secreted protein
MLKMKQKTSKQSNLPKGIIIALAAIAVIAVIAFGVATAIVRSQIPVFDDGSELSVIELTTNGGVPYEWNYEFENSDIAEIADKTSNARDPEADGGVVDLKYVIKGKKPGKTKLTFRYGSFIDGRIEETRNYLIEVNEKLEVRITEQN